MSSPLKKDEVFHPHRLSFLEHLSPDYLEALEAEFADNPQALSADWQFFFEAYQLGKDAGGETPSEERPSAAAETQSAPQTAIDPSVVDELKVLNLISAYRARGHLMANIDPLGLRRPPFDLHLDLGYFKLDKVDPKKTFQAAEELGLKPSTLTEIVTHLTETYCGHVGVEFQYIRDESIYRWLKSRVDVNKNSTAFSQEQKLRILKHLYRTSIFESFLQNNYTGQKRFSLEGAEALIPALKHAIVVCAETGAEEVTIGMAHRGRLNVLANVMKKPYQEIFKEFEHAELPEAEEISGDVKYHQGFSTDIETPAGKQVHLSLAPNPSHLEFVDPVVQGAVKAKQEAKYSNNTDKVVPILIHGDAAVIGQGVVAETLNLSQLEGYKTGGTIHIVINNQIGFTTLPQDSRSSLYCTDYGKGFQTPIFHVNGDEVEDVIHAIGIAAEYRMKFKSDVFVDIVCYRKYGHNEGDEPRFTQPHMYALIEKHPSPLEVYLERLRADVEIDNAIIDEFSIKFERELASKREEIQKAPKILSKHSYGGLWKDFQPANGAKLTDPVGTEISSQTFDQIVDVIHHIPSHIKPLPKFVRMLDTRLKKIKGEDQIDWAVGEQIGLGSLLLEGHGVRLSGQDSIRGTFSHRHAAMTDNTTSERFFPLQHLSKDQGKFNVYDSPLSETGVLGFDYGYSTTNPKVLVCWEAQFGDFANGAQVIIDQFISSAESKWYRMSGLTLLLPHGFEGQGPEHSSARLERFLQLCAQQNMQVCYPTTPAQYCHLLRRQMHRKFRKPLVVITPKSMLRMPEVVSTKSDFTNGRFQNILQDIPAKAEKIVLCTGKIYWELKSKAAEAGKAEKIGFLRIEQLYPLDTEALKQIYKKYSQLPWIWVQEEPKNMGAWSYMRLATLDHGIDLQYIGRKAAASPATGSHNQHHREQEQIIKDAVLG